MGKRLSRRALLGGAAAVAGVAATAHHVFARGEHVPKGISDIAVDAAPFDGFDLKDRGRRAFGKLQFKGGMRLTSAAPAFGGFSGLRLDASGKSLVAISDRGAWLTASIVEREGAAIGLAKARMAPILGPNGQPLGLGRDYDTESLADDGPYFYVGCERTNNIFRFDWARHGVAARGEPVAVPKEVKAFGYNSGCEALAVIPKGQKLAGALVALAERQIDANGNSIGVLIGGPQPGPFAVTRRDDFDFTDLAVLPGGDLVLLERFFTFIRGVKMRIRRLPVDQLRPGAVLDGEVLIEADLGFEIDNMEGIGVHRAADGATILTLISDDNFSPIQRTILLQFALAE